MNTTLMRTLHSLLLGCLALTLSLSGVACVEQTGTKEAIEEEIAEAEQGLEPVDDDALEEETLEEELLGGGDDRAVIGGDPMEPQPQPWEPIGGALVDGEPDPSPEPVDPVAHTAHTTSNNGSGK